MALRPWFVVLAACTVVLVLMTGDLLAHGMLFALDWKARGLRLENHLPALKAPVTLLVMMGQRAFTIPVALVVVAYLVRRVRSWHPLALLVVSLLGHNLVVGAAKLFFGRAKGETGSGDFFAGGTIYPSGHTSNTVITYGLIVYLLVGYDVRRLSRGLLALAALPTVIVSAGSLFINSHWLSDIVSGWLFGAIILCATVVLDQVLVTGTPLRGRPPVRLPPEGTPAPADTVDRVGSPGTGGESYRY